MVHIAAWQQIYYNGLPPACQAFYHYTFHLFPIFSPQWAITFPRPALHFSRAFVIILSALILGGYVYAFLDRSGRSAHRRHHGRVASKRGDEGEALKKVGIALIFIGTAILLFVLTINILVWTGRFGVAS